MISHHPQNILYGTTEISRNQTRSILTSVSKYPGENICFWYHFTKSLLIVPYTNLCMLLKPYFLFNSKFGVLKLTIGIRMNLDDELRGSDEVEHNIREGATVIERRHALGKHVERDRNEELIHIQPLKSEQVVA